MKTDFDLSHSILQDAKDSFKLRHPVPLKRKVKPLEGKAVTHKYSYKESPERHIKVKDHAYYGLFANRSEA